MKRSKALYISLILIVFLTLVLSASFAWFSVTLQSKGNTIKTGKFKYSVIGYNKANSGVEKVSTLISPIEIEREELSETDLTNMKANSPIIDTVLNPGDIYSSYVSIEFLTGSVDFDYAISFTVDTNEGNPDYLGAFTFRVEDITAAVTAKSGANISEKIGAYANSLSPVSMPTTSMSNIEQFRAQGSLTSSSNPAYKVYRIDVAMDENYSSFSYTDLEFVSNVNVVVGQVGTLDDSQTSSQNTFYVSSESDLEYALANIRNNDIIQFVASIEYDKDLAFTNSVNIVFNPGVYCKVLGNVNFEYSSGLESSIKSDGNDKCGFIIKNNFNFSAPSGSLVLEASSNNTYGLITAGGNINIQANRQDGVSINGAKFKATEVNGSNIDATTVDKQVFIGSNTHVIVSSISEIYKLVSMNRANNIKITVNGRITDQIDLSSMFNNGQTEYPQIEILSYSQFGLSINLPSWSRTWVSTYDEGTHSYLNTGNTKISRSINSGAITFLSTSVDVEYDAISGDNYVVDNDTTGTFANQNKDLTVYYQDKYIGVTPQGTLNVEEQSLHTILVNYFRSVIMASPAQYSVDVSNQAQVDAKINTLINNITRLTIESKGKALKSVRSSTDVDADDFYFIRTLSNDLENSHLVYLDLEKALLEDNTLPFSALYNTRMISELTLPSSCVALGQQSLMNCGATEITIPQSVTAFGSGSLSGANIIHISSYIEPSEAENMASWTQSAGITVVTPIILVSRNLYDTYVKNHVAADGITYTNNFMNFLFVDGILDHSKKYILETTQGGYNITCYRDTVFDTTTAPINNLITLHIGDDITLDSNPNIPVTIKGISYRAFSKIEQVKYNGTAYNFVIELSNDITTLDAYAFARYTGSAVNNEFKGVALNSSITEIPEYCFANNRSFDNAHLSLTNVTQIDQFAFFGCTGITSVPAYNVTKLYNGAFKNCTGLTEIFLNSLTNIDNLTSDPNAAAKTDKVFDGCNSLEYVYLGYTGDLVHNNMGTFGFESSDLTIVSLQSNAALSSQDFSDPIPSGLRIYIYGPGDSRHSRSNNDYTYRVLGYTKNFYYYEDNYMAYYDGLQVNKDVLPYIREVPRAYNFTNGNRLVVKTLTSAANQIDIEYIEYTKNSTNYSLIVNMTKDETLTNATVTFPSTQLGRTIERIGYRAFTDMSIQGVSLVFENTIEEFGHSAFEGFDAKIGTIAIMAVSDYEDDAQFRSHARIDKYAFDSTVTIGVNIFWIYAPDGTTPLFKYSYIPTSVTIENTNYTGERILFAEFVQDETNPAYTAYLTNMKLPESIDTTNTMKKYKTTNITQNTYEIIGDNADDKLVSLYQEYTYTFGNRDYGYYIGEANITNGGYYTRSNNYSQGSIQGSDGYYYTENRTYTYNVYYYQLTNTTLSYSETYATYERILSVSTSLFNNMTQNQVETIQTLDLPTSIVNISGQAFTRLSSLTQFKVTSVQINNIDYLMVDGFNTAVWRYQNGQTYNIQLLSTAMSTSSPYYGALYHRGYVQFTQGKKTGDASISLNSDEYGACTLVAYPQAKTQTAFRLSSDCFVIGEYAFYGAKNLRRVEVVGNRARLGLQVIGQHCFQNCNENIIIGIDNYDVIPYVGNQAFYINPDQGTMIKGVYIARELIAFYQTDAFWSEYNSILNFYYAKVYTSNSGNRVNSEANYAWMQ